MQWMYRWFSYLALPRSVDRNDFSAAAILIAPEPILTECRVREALVRMHQQDPIATSHRAVELVEAYERTEELALLFEAGVRSGAAEGAWAAQASRRPRRRSDQSDGGTRLIIMAHR